MKLTHEVVKIVENRVCYQWRNTRPTIVRPFHIQRLRDPRYHQFNIVPDYESPFRMSSAFLFFCETLPLRSAGFNDPSSPTFLGAWPDSLAVFFNRSVSCGFKSCFLSCSSSLSPRLNGSLSSPSGFGAIEVNGCHFFPPLPVPGVDCWLFKASTSSTGPVGAAGVGLNRFGFASGRAGLGGGDAGKTKVSLNPLAFNTWYA